MGKMQFLTVQQYNYCLLQYYDDRLRCLLSRLTKIVVQKKRLKKQHEIRKPIQRNTLHLWYLRSTHAPLLFKYHVEYCCTR